MFPVVYQSFNSGELLLNLCDEKGGQILNLDNFSVRTPMNCI